MPWIYLLIAGVLEVVWAYAMKLSEGFTQLTPLYSHDHCDDCEFWLAWDCDAHDPSRDCLRYLDGHWCHWGVSHWDCSLSRTSEYEPNSCCPSYRFWSDSNATL